MIDPENIKIITTNNKHVITYDGHVICDCHTQIVANTIKNGLLKFVQLLNLLEKNKD